MRDGGFYSLLILLKCVIVVTSGGAGKKVLLKIHVPELIKHQHHTNVVFVHKHHHHDGDHDKHHHKHHHHHHHHHADHDKHHHKHHDDGGNDHAHTYTGHYSHNDGELPGYHHSHSFGHQHRFSFSHGDGDKHHGQNLGSRNRGHKKKTRGGKAKHGGFGKKGQIHKPYHKIHGSKKHPKKENENIYDFAINYNDPNTKTQHYHYETFSPTFSFDNNNNVQESNHTIRHESLKIETNENSLPEAENFENFPKTQTNGDYEIEEPSFHFQTEHHNANYDKNPSGFQGNSEYYGNDDEEQNKGLGSYAEDYTNPNSVAKYTAAIQHGTINLQDTTYNPEHGNDIEEYIRTSKYSNAI